MTNVEKLLSISSEALSKPPIFPELLRGYILGSELFAMLEQRNGFYAFESALHVLPIVSPNTGLEGWNASSLWRREYKNLAEGLLFFGEDVLQDQFCLSEKQTGVFRFESETGRTTYLADSIEAWAALILSDYKMQTGWPFVHEWQRLKEPLEPGKRLMPKTPFFLGGQYSIDNLWAGDAVEGMRLKADMAAQTRDLPEGAKVKFNVGPRPQ